MEEPKMRGRPTDEVPRAPIHRVLQKKEAAKAETKAQPHNAVEAAIAQAPERHEPVLQDQGTKVAIITGASAGIGKAVAIHLASSNYNVVLLARKKEKLHAVEQELAKYRIRTLVRECDVTKVVQVHEAVQHAIKLFGRIDVLVNCAGYGVYGELETMRLEDINGQMLTNYFGTVLCIKECLPKLKEHKGVIVNVASMTGLVGIPKMAAYSASKSAIVGLSEALRFELEGTGVSVVCVCPGKVETGFFDHPSFTDAHIAQDAGIAPGRVAAVVDKAIKERKSLYVVPGADKFLLVLGRLLPETFTRKQVRRRMQG
jgi:hypothetical protein